MFWWQKCFNFLNELLILFKNCKRIVNKDQRKILKILTLIKKFRLCELWKMIDI